MKKLIIFLVILVIILGIGYYFRNGLVNFYKTTSLEITQSFPDFKKIDVGTVINEVNKDILNPPPLKIGGQANESVLTKTGIIRETNLQRRNNGLPALSENAKLDAAALAKTNDMFFNQYFEHTSPAGVDPGKLVLNYEYKYIVAGENLIMGNFASEKELVQAWMSSPGHRANILNNRYTEIGAAVVKGTYKGETVWMGVQEFGLPLSTCPEPSVTLKNQIGDRKTQLDSLSSEIDREKIKIENTSTEDPDYNNLIDQYNGLVRQYQSLADEIKNLISQYNQQVNNFNSCVKGTGNLLQ